MNLAIVISVCRTTWNTELLRNYCSLYGYAVDDEYWVAGVPVYSMLREDGCTGHTPSAKLLLRKLELSAEYVTSYKVHAEIGAAVTVRLVGGLPPFMLEYRHRGTVAVMMRKLKARRDEGLL